MVDSLEEDIFTDFSLLLHLTNLWGFTSFEIVESNSSRKCLVHQKWHYLIYFAFKILICMCGYCSLKIFLIYFHMHYNLFFILEVLVQLTTLISQVASSICNSVYVNKHRKLWQRLYEIEKHLSRSSVGINHKLLWRIALACVISTIIFTTYSLVAAVVLYYEMRKDIEKPLMFGGGLFYIYRCATSSMVVCQHISSFSVLREIFLKLRDATQRKFLGNIPSRSKDLLQIARYHQLSCEIAREANSVISIQLLVESVNIICLVIDNLFGCTLSLMNEHYTSQNVVKYSGWIVSGTLYIVAFCSFVSWMRQKRKCNL